MAEEKKPKAAKAAVSPRRARKGRRRQEVRQGQGGGAAAGGEERGSRGAVKAELPTGVYTPRLKKHYDEVVRAETDQAVRL